MQLRRNLAERKTPPIQITNHPHLQSENGGRGSLPIIVGRSLPRAIATAKAVGHRHNRDDASGQRSNTGGSTSTGKKDGRRGNERTNDHEEIEMEDLIAGHPRRAVEELTMRARLEVVRGEVDEALKMHRTMARGERTSWLMQIERQNEQGAYQVCKHASISRMRHFHTTKSSLSIVPSPPTTRG